MKLEFRKYFSSIAMAGALAYGNLASAAYPEKPITIIYPYAPGSASDTLTRWMAEMLQKSLGQPVIVDNRPGAGGSIGTEHVIRSAPDGYTLALTASGTIAVNPHIYKLPHQPLDSLEQISIAVEVPFVFIVNKHFAAQDYKSFVALAKRKPGAITSANAGIGTQAHLTQVAFAKIAGLDLNILAYKGGSPAVNDVLGGHVDSMIDNAAAQIPYITAKQVTPLFVTSDYRFEAYPDVPTAKELGINGLTPAGWFGLAAPKGTPRDVIDKLNSALVAALKQPENAKKLKSMGWVIVASSPEEATRRAKSDFERLGAVVRDVHLKIN